MAFRVTIVHRLCVRHLKFTQPTLRNALTFIPIPLFSCSTTEGLDSTSQWKQYVGQPGSIRFDTVRCTTPAEPIRCKFDLHSNISHSKIFRLHLHAAHNNQLTSCTGHVLHTNFAHKTDLSFTFTSSRN